MGGGGGDGAGVLPAEPTPQAAPAAPYRPTPHTEVNTFWITFQVLDNDTGAPLPGVDLRLKRPGGDVNIYTTDAASIALSSAPTSLGI